MLKLPSISKKVRCLWSPTSSMSVVRKLFWLLVMRRAGGVCSPVKKGLKGTMPALVNSSVGSPAGINDALGIWRWPFSVKNRMKEFLTSSPFMGLPAGPNLPGLALLEIGHPMTSRPRMTCRPRGLESLAGVSGAACSAAPVEGTSWRLLPRRITFIRRRASE